MFRRRRRFRDVIERQLGFFEQDDADLLDDVDRAAEDVRLAAAAAYRAVELAAATDQHLGADLARHRPNSLDDGGHRHRLALLDDGLDLLVKVVHN